MNKDILGMGFCKWSRETSELTTAPKNILLYNILWYTSV